ncbi:FadR/GntR family transcriptional regulator [Arthrobacter sp. MA-N2]|uniref:FadR/GntR family transcriptional regulator n=1 Tax=Arthrobacter sp. MA-N2 TaxID=1101188 RepID=UPI0018CBF2DD|nr:FadR/GntR family transcriptional regulator [Arthrobacter sp. MA-N2]
MGSAAPALGRPVKIAERIASIIVTMIIESNLQPGDRLPNEADMLEQFDVGRGSLREALRILETYGLINLRSGPGGGPVLLDVSPSDVSRSFSLFLNLKGSTIRELVEARKIIDPLVARMAAEAVTPESAAMLRAALDREASFSDTRGVVDAANDVHYVLSRMTDNSVFNLLATALKEMYTTRLTATGLAERLAQPHLHSEHREIGEAVIAGNADLAEALMRAHLSRSLDGALEATGFGSTVITWG